MARKPDPEKQAEREAAAALLAPPSEFSNEVTRMFIEKAIEIRDAMAELAKQKTSNKTMVRGMLTGGMFNEDETRWAVNFYNPRSDSELAKELGLVSETADSTEAAEAATSTETANVVDMPKPPRTRRSRAQKAS